MRGRPITKAHDAPLKSVLVLFSRSLRRQVTNLGRLTDTLIWPMRWTRDEQDLPWLLILKLNFSFSHPLYGFSFQCYFPRVQFWNGIVFLITPPENWYQCPYLALLSKQFEEYWSVGHIYGSSNAVGVTAGNSYLGMHSWHHNDLPNATLHNKYHRNKSLGGQRIKRENNLMLFWILSKLKMAWNDVNLCTR